MDASIGRKADTVIIASFAPPLFFNFNLSIPMNPSSDSAGPSRHGKRPMIHLFSSSSSESSSSSSSSEGRRYAAAAAAAAEEEDKSTATQPECYVCGRRFGNLKALFGHMRCHPEREWRGIRPLAVGEEGSRGRRRWRRRTSEESAAAAATAAGEYACGECARVFGTRQALGGHRASHRGVMGCSAKAKETTAAAGAALPDVRGGGAGDGRTFFCQVCERQFVTYHGMRVHQRVHRERQGGEAEGRREERGFMVDLNLPPPPEVAEEEDKPVANEQ
ncbi:zinc finger protein ZAT2-like [Dendrobium catenatum]|uniref:Zinc finger protein ZAT2 n=1 Tax=Dendrobium catenatum TaxID=906689 RepID=A0A2I0XC97_9ASPA|nr:zinc finger protein ZAT2-like [Dendrobium catenatum]PKU85530.1 Zinc finger protein ZAT2 [Dendrobium catenatum]